MQLRSLFVFILLFGMGLFSVSGQKRDTLVHLVPMPVSAKLKPGNFTINKQTFIAGNKYTTQEAKYLRDFIKTNYGWSLQIKESSSATPLANAINLRAAKAFKEENEYTLVVSAGNIEIAGAGSTGVFYGIQTLLQLLEPEKTALPIKLGNIDIYDYPRFKYRGMHLDVARHFFPVTQVKKYIDYLAAHKFNNFHWHLTDDQGWRIEIKKYPKLTSVGSCRAQTLVGRFGTNRYDSTRYCGYYSQAEVKEVITYAAERHINVIPEIEMPGHAMAALASYPELGCTGGPYKVWETWGVIEDIFCAGKDSTFDLLEGVLDEVITLFPSQLIHIGGDEAPKTRWKTCPRCQQRIKDNNLKNESELQGYFTKRIESYINSKGRRLLGWDEIHEGNINPSATIMNWRGERIGIAAAKGKHDVIVTPESYVYLDYSQTRNEDSITIGNYLPVEKVYSFEPLPSSLNVEEGKYIIGGQGNVWSEYISNFSKLQYMIFPRMSALSEALWSQPKIRNWQRFEKLIPSLMKRYEFWGAEYSMAYYGMEPSVIPGDDNRSVYWKVVSRFAADIMLYDSVEKRQAYGQKDVRIKVDHPGMFRGLMMEAKPDGRTLGTIQQYFHFNKATGKPVKLATQPNVKYSNGGAFALVNGIITTRGMSQSSHFLGFLGTDMEAVIDLGEEQDIKNVTVNVFGQNESWIYLPSSVSAAIVSSPEPSSKSSERNFVVQTIDESTPKSLRKVVLPVNGRGRYIKVTAKNYGIIPAGKPGAGTRAWTFVDEIEVD